MAKQDAKAAPKAAAPKQEAKAAAAPKKAMTKGELFEAIATSKDLAEMNLTRKQVASIFEVLTGLMTKQLGKKGAGVFVIPGVAKITAVKKAATKGGNLVKNPFTGQMVPAKPKPASFKLKARAVKSFADCARQVSRFSTGMPTRAAERSASRGGIPAPDGPRRPRTPGLPAQSSLS